MYLKICYVKSISQSSQNVEISPNPVTLLVLATLGGATQKGLFLFFVASPKVTKASAVMCRWCWSYRAKLCQWKGGFR
jgi:hypothetical protein